jgi:hypothetical protein
MFKDYGLHGGLLYCGLQRFVTRVEGDLVQVQVCSS